jgi:hypothetical protein
MDLKKTKTYYIHSNQPQKYNSSYELYLI